LNKYGSDYFLKYLGDVEKNEDGYFLKLDSLSEISKLFDSGESRGMTDEEIVSEVLSPDWFEMYTFSSRDINWFDDIVDNLDDIPEEEPFSDFALRGLRLLTSLLEGQEQELEDVNAENAELLQISEDEDEIIAPSLEYVACILEEEGITYKKLVAWLLMDHEEYSDREEEYENFAGDIWGKLRIIISNYTNEFYHHYLTEVATANEVATDEVATDEVAANEVAANEVATEVSDEEEHQEEASCIQEEPVEEKQTKSEEERRSPLEIWGVWKEREMLQFIVDYQAQPKTRIQDLIQNLETLAN
jgi:hypothetical protein